MNICRQFSECFPHSSPEYQPVYCANHGYVCLDYEPKSTPGAPQIIEHIHRTSNMGAKEFDLLQQTVLKLDFLEKKLTEHTEYKRKVPVKSGKTKGIKIE